MSPEKKTNQEQEWKAAQAAAYEKWWASLSQKVRRAITRYAERKAAKRLARAVLRGAGWSGYCCPKCHAWLGTPEERKACRESHWKKEEVRA